MMEPDTTRLKALALRAADYCAEMGFESADSRGESTKAIQFAVQDAFALGLTEGSQPVFTADDLCLIASCFTDLATEARESNDPDMVAEAPILNAVARKAGIAVPSGHVPTFQLTTDKE